MAGRLPLRPPRDLCWGRDGHPFHQSCRPRDWHGHLLGFLPLQLLHLVGGGRGSSLPAMWPPGNQRRSRHVLPRLLLARRRPLPLPVRRLAGLVPRQGSWRDLHPGRLRPRPRRRPPRPLPPRQGLRSLLPLQEQLRGLRHLLQDGAARRNRLQRWPQRPARVPHCRLQRRRLVAAAFPHHQRPRPRRCHHRHVLSRPVCLGHGRSPGCGQGPGSDPRCCYGGGRGHSRDCCCYGGGSRDYYYGEGRDDSRDLRQRSEPPRLLAEKPSSSSTVSSAMYCLHNCTPSVIQQASYCEWL